MDIIRVKERKKDDILPEDIYPAKLVKYKSIEGDPDTDKQPRMQLTFRPLVKKYADKIATYAIWGKYDENGKAYVEKGSKYHKTLVILNDGDEDIDGIKMKNLVGVAKCRIDVVHSEPSKKTGAIYANVMRVLPFKAKSADFEEEDVDEEEVPKKKKKHFDEEDEERASKKNRRDSEDEDDFEDDEEEKPKKKKKTDEDDFDDEEEKPAKKKKEKTKEEDDDLFEEDDDDF